MFQVLLSVVVLAATIFTLVNVITTDQSQIRYLDKVVWIILVILVPVIGVILWWTMGRERDGASEAVSFGDPRRREERRPPEPVPDEAEIEAQVEREIAFHENEARLRRLEAELRARREGLPPGEK